ncbi:MAG: pilus assembly protein PilM, partial [Phycisphaeraceae bacterium]|nr:pilus assembly protein PilM [Phycisphaeraceae bacterium]
WDFQVFQEKDSPDVEVGIFAIARERVNQFLSNYKAVGMGVDGLTLSPVAVFNALTYDQEPGTVDQGVVFVDIGSVSTDVIVSAGQGIWVRTLQIGGNDFTEALVKSFKLSFSKAEKLKREAATSKYAKQIFQAMRPVFSDLVQELQRSLGYYQSQNREASLKRMIGVGSTFRLPGLQKFLKQQLQMDVTRLSSFKKLTVQGKEDVEFADQAVNLATAYGLALQGLGMQRVSANILPASVRQQRQWRAKQPWFAAAAGVIVAATAWNAVTLVQARNAFDEGQLSSVDNVVRQASNLKSRWDESAQAADPRAQMRTLQSLLDGRSVWPLILTDIEGALEAANPQPQTLAADYQKMAQIPRPERRRIYITSMSTAYRVGSGGLNANAWSPPTAGQNRPEKEAWRTDPWAGVADGSSVAPSFQITLRGTTPNKDGVTFFTQTFVAKLRELAGRNDRPYKMVISANPVVEFDKVVTGTPGAGRQPAGPSYADVPGMLPPSFASGPNMSMSSNSTDMARVLPTRPLLDESRQDDWRFEIGWTIDLLPPDQARAAEERLASGPEAPAPSKVEQPPTGEPGAAPGEPSSSLRPTPSDAEQRS